MTPQQIPEAIFTTANRNKLTSVYDAKQRYKIFVALLQQEELNQICFTVIGKNGTFCTEQQCQKSHAEFKIQVAPGTVFIKRSPTKAFLEPVVDSTNWDFKLMNKWLEDTCTLSEWVKRFGLVQGKQDVSGTEIITEASIAQEVELKEKRYFFNPQERENF